MTLLLGTFVYLDAATDDAEQIIDHTLSDTETFPFPSSSSSSSSPPLPRRDLLVTPVTRTEKEKRKEIYVFPRNGQIRLADVICQRQISIEPSVHR